MAALNLRCEWDSVLKPLETDHSRQEGEALETAEPGRWPARILARAAHVVLKEEGLRSCLHNVGLSATFPLSCA